MAASFGRFVLACLLDRLRTPALGCSFEAALRVHSDGPLRSCFYLSARTPVRSDGRRTQSPFPALAPFTYRASVRRLLWELLLSMLRAPSLARTFWVLTLLLVHASSVRRSRTFVLRAEHLRSAFAPRIRSVLCPPSASPAKLAMTFRPPQNLAHACFVGCFRTSALTFETSRCLAALAMFPTCSRSADRT